MLSRTQKWDRRYLRLAREAASWSKDPSTKVGCVVVDGDGDVIAVTFNGLPRRVEDTVERYANRELKYRMVEHAERNGTRVATKQGGATHGTTFYTYPLPPCAPCAGHLLQHGAQRIVAVLPEDSDLLNRWAEDLNIAKEMYQEAGIDLMLYSPDFLEDR